MKRNGLGRRMLRAGQRAAQHMVTALRRIRSRGGCHGHRGEDAMTMMGRRRERTVSARAAVGRTGMAASGHGTLRRLLGQAGPPARRAMALLRHRWRWAAWPAGIVAGLLVGVNLWVVGTTAGYRYQQVGDVPARQAAIVPGALVYRDGRPSDILADRLQTALELYRAGKVGKILASGDHGRVQYDEVNAMRRWLEARGVRSEDIFMDHAGFDTCDTMQRARRVFCVASAVVVTQDFHLPRAVYLARQAGIDAVGVKADRHRYRKEMQNTLRESVARVKSFAEVHFGSGPRFLGPEIPIGGDGRATWDQAAR